MAVCLTITAVATMLGLWQYGRHVARADARAAYDAAVDQAPAPLTDVVPAGSSALPDDARWRTVVATGTWDADSLVILRPRPVDGTAAWQYLAWLDTDDGQSVLVNLGWVPEPGPLEDPALPELSGGAVVTVTGVVREWEEDDGKEPAVGTVTRIVAEQLPAASQHVMPGYVMAREICVDSACEKTGYGTPAPLPSLTLGPHLSYAAQWWVFALMAPIGGVLLLRRDARIQAEGAEPSTQAVPRRRRERPLTDEEIEDAL